MLHAASLIICVPLLGSLVLFAFGKRLGEGELKGLVVSREKTFYVESDVGFMARA